MLWLANKFSTNDEYYDDVTSDIQRLHGILGGILADGRITEPELNALRAWVEERAYLKQCWPYDRLDGVITHVLRDGRIDAQEHEALLQLFGEFASVGERKAVGALEPEITVSGVCENAPSVSFQGNYFCLTGKSKRATKDEFAVVVRRCGGSFHDNLRIDTNYLIVGANGNPCWAFACYGRKVEGAVERRRNGQCILIVHEHHFWLAVDSMPAALDDVVDKSVSSTRMRGTQKSSREKKSNEAVSIPIRETSCRLAGKTLVVTGTLAKYKREEIEALIVQYGGRAGSSVSKKTDYLIAGEKAGSKLDKAKSLGVQVISEAEFDQLIGAA